VPKKLNAVMARCTECKEEDWAGYVLLPAEASWFYAQNRPFRFTCRYCGAEFRSEPYLKGVDSLGELFRGQKGRPKSDLPSGGTG
jgi:hypothetical protein